MHMGENQIPDKISAVWVKAEQELTVCFSEFSPSVCVCVAPA